MQLCAHSNGPSYAGGFNIDHFANLSYFERSGSNLGKSAAYRVAPVSQTVHEAFECFIERLSQVIIGSGTRYLGLDDLVQEVKSLTQAAEPAWAMLVNNASSAVDMLTISKTIESIAVEAQADPGCIDLSRINRKSPSPQHLVALLRTTYAFKDKITGWSELRDFAKAYVDEKGFVSARVMKGLDD